ncbi:MAG: YceI family protein [SAR324 cluster bacterium]|nr:YceI family protein [SAR324 cluster bacterium]
MKAFKFLSPLLIFFFLNSSLQAQEFQSDKNCLAYHVEKTMFLFKEVTVWGTSCEVKAKVTPKAGGVVASVEFPFNSLDSTEQKRDTELQTNYFFTEKFPTISFTSSTIPFSALRDLKAGTEIEIIGAMTVMELASEVTFTLKLIEGHLVGTMNDSITRLGVKLPKVMGGGMVKVHDPLEVKFDFLVALVPGAMTALK